MRITLLGNCQTKALAWYIQQLNSSFDVRWVCAERFLSGWGSGSKFSGKPINVITDTQEAIERLESSDYVIFQPLKARFSKNYNLAQIKKYTKNAKFITISSFVYKPEDPEQKYLKGMIERAKNNNIDISAHELIEKHGSKITCELPHHPHVFYFLELVREICSKTGWDYYSNEQYNQYLKEGFPFG